MKMNRFILPVILLMVHVCSCRTSKITTTESRQEESLLTEEKIERDSTEREVVKMEQITDSTTTEAEENGVIDILRDSVGRPVKIEYKIKHRTVVDHSSELRSMMQENEEIQKELTTREEIASETKMRGTTKETVPVKAPGWTIIFPVLLLVMIVAIIIWQVIEYGERNNKAQ